MQTNYFYFKNGIQVKGLGVALSIKKEFIKIEYLINLGLFKIEKSKYSFLRNDIVATTLPKLKIALKTEISNAWRDLIDEDNNQLSKENLIIKESLIENFKEFFFYAVIPETSLNPLRYVSGFGSLTVPFSENIAPYIHSCWKDYCRIFNNKQYLYGENCEFSTNHILGDEGIIDISNDLKELNLPFKGEKSYFAHPYRATVDLALKELFTSELLNENSKYFNINNDINLIYVDSCTLSETENQQIISMSKKAMPYLKDYQKIILERWMNFREDDVK